MKKQLYLRLLICFQISCAYGWDAIIVPLSYNKTLDQWNVLVGKNADDTWSVFRKEGHGRGAHQFAAAALNEQTNDTYTIDPESVRSTPFKRLANGDVVHFVPVNYIDAPTIYKRVESSGGNRIKNDFAWLPVGEIINNETITKTVRGRLRTYAFSQGTRRILGDHVHNALNEIAGKGTSAQQQRLSSSQQSVTSWANIPGAIYFYERNNPYFEFTNFADFTVKDEDNFTWPTSEHYFQSQKFKNNSNLYEQIKKIQNTREVFDFAQKNKAKYDQQNWQNSSIKAMLDAVRRKFNQHKNLSALLRGTHDKILVEDAGDRDKFWGAGGNYQGANMLGQVLMRVRSELLEEIDLDEEYIFYATPAEYFNKKNKKVVAQGSGEIQKPSISGKKPSETGDSSYYLVMKLNQLTSALKDLGRAL